MFIRHNASGLCSQGKAGEVDGCHFKRATTNKSQFTNALCENETAQSAYPIYEGA